MVWTLTARQTSSQTAQPPSTAVIFQWKRSIYLKQSVSFKSVAFGTKLILRGGIKKEDEHFDKVEMLHLGLSGAQYFKMTFSPLSKREIHCKT